MSVTLLDVVERETATPAREQKSMGDSAGRGVREDDGVGSDERDGHIGVDEKDGFTYIVGEGLAEITVTLMAITRRAMDPAIKPAPALRVRRADEDCTNRDPSTI